MKRRRAKYSKGTAPIPRSTGTSRMENFVKPNSAMNGMLR